MNETTPLVKGSIVKYQNGFMEVRAVFKNTVNLGPIFYSRTTVKGVARELVVPAYDEWHEYWSKSEAYQSM
jgi:hypothetical protein